MTDLANFWVVVGTSAPVIGLAHVIQVGTYWRRSDEALNVYRAMPLTGDPAADVDYKLALWKRAKITARGSAAAEWTVAASFLLCIAALWVALLALQGDSIVPAAGMALTILPLIALVLPPAVELWTNRKERAGYWDRLGPSPSSKVT